MIAEAIAWYLLLTVQSKDYPYHIIFETESDCEYVGRIFKAESKGRITYRCWNAQRPPIRPMGGVR